MCLDWELYCLGNDLPSHEQYLSTSEDIIQKKVNTVPAFNASGWIITVGDGEVPPAFELASRYLKRHAVAWVVSHSKYAYGHLGRLKLTTDSESNEYSIPPYTTVLFCIKNRGIACSTCPLFHQPKFLLNRVEHKKRIGNQYYQYEWIDHGGGKSRALKLYGSACESLMNLIREMDTKIEEEKEDYTDPTENTDSLKIEAVQLLVDCFNNIAAYHLRDKAYGKAKEAAANALRYNPENRKALQRAAKAAMLDPSGTYEESDLAISILEELEPHEEETKKLRHELQRRKKDYKRREKEMYSRMVNGISKYKEDSVSVKDEPQAIHENKQDQLEKRAVIEENTGSKRLSYRYMVLSLFLQLGVIALLWWMFPALREKFAESKA